MENQPSRFYFDTGIFLLILFSAIAIRFIYFSHPPIGYFEWRQTYTLGITLNFLEFGMNLWHPQTYVSGMLEHYAPANIETNFPLYEYLVAAIGKIVGISHVNAIGRVINILLSAGLIIVFYKFLSNLFNRKAALFGILIFAFSPLYVQMGRIFQPELPMIFMLAAGVCCFYYWARYDMKYTFVLSLLLVTLACMIKPYSLYVGLPLIYLSVLKYGKKALISPRLWIYAISVFSGIFIWYYHMHQVQLGGAETVHIWDQDKWANWSLLFTRNYWYITFFESVFHSNITPGFVFLAAFGLLIKRHNKWDWFIDLWLIGAVIQILITTYGAYIQDYYTMGVAVPAAALTARLFYCLFELTVTRFKIITVFFRLLFVSAAMLFVYNSLSYAYELNSINFAQEQKEFIHPEKVAHDMGLYLGQLLQKHTPDNATVYTIDIPSPAALTLGMRRGLRDSGYGFIDNASGLTAYLKNHHSKIANSYIASCNLYSSFPAEKRKAIMAIIEQYKKVYVDDYCFIYKTG